MKLVREYTKNIEINKKKKKMIRKNFSWKLLHRIHDSTGFGMHNIIIYNSVSHNFQFLFRF